LNEGTNVARKRPGPQKQVKNIIFASEIGEFGNLTKFASCKTVL
jgi:hypothetical protein